MATKTFTEKARRLLKESGMTYTEVGVRMGFPPESAKQNIYCFLQGANPSFAMARKFADALGVEIGELA